MGQSVWNPGVAVERYAHKSQGALTARDYQPFFAVRKCPAAQRLQNGLELLGLEGRKRWGGFRIRVKHVNTTQGQRNRPEVRQMQLVHHIEMSSVRERCRLEWHAHLER